MDLKELGLLMRNQREALGSSIEDISESTRISRRILTVFEAGDEENYPHPVYAKGFIRNYARALGLDEEKCLRVLEKNVTVLDNIDPENTHPTLQEMEQPVVVESSEKKWPVILGAFFLIALLVAMIWYFSFSDMTASMQSEASVVQEAIPEQAAVDPPEVGDAMPAAVEESSAAVEHAAETPAAQDAAGAAGQADEAPLQASAGETAEALEAAEQVPVKGEHTLLIEVVGKKPCWIGVWMPGQDEIIKDFTVPVGRKVEYKFTGKRIVRFGRIETVKLTIDGKNRPLKGKGVVNVTLP